VVIRSHRLILKREFACCVLLGGLLLFTGASRALHSEPAAQTAPSSAWSGSLVFTQLPRQTAAEKQGPLADGMLRQPFGDGARIVVWHPGAAPQPLVTGFHSACDPQVSFDGKKIVFAGKRKAHDNWDIFEMAIDGTGLRQITKDMGNCRNPIYQGTLFTLDSKEPWYQICFVSDLAQEVNEYGPFPASDLYSCQLDGSELRRLTFNPSSDMDPWMLPDGRMVYAAWQLATLQHGWQGRVALHVINTDGTDNSIFCGDEGLRIKQMPCVTRSRLVVFVESNKLAWDGAGRLASVSLRRNLYSYHSITSDRDGLFLSPSPLPDGQILVSRRGLNNQKTHGIYRLDPATGRIESVFDDPKYHDIQARAIAAQPAPDGRSTVVLESEPTGKIYCLDIRISDLAGDDWAKNPSDLKLRVLEGIPPKWEPSTDRKKPARMPRPGAEGEYGLSPSIQKRFLGEIGIEADGSFNIQVPANTPIQLQLVDSHGMALRSSYWIWAKNKEHRGCIGCHEDSELTPPNRFVSALSRPSVPLILPPDRRRTVDFRRDVMPIVEKKCATAACHASPTAVVKLDATPVHAGPNNKEQYYSRSYTTLLGNSEAKIYVCPGRARTSPLIWHLFGRNTSRPWDDSYKSDYPVKPMPPAGNASLTESERRTFVEWVDLGALWSGIPDQATTSDRASKAPTDDNSRKPVDAAGGM
jgi:hypothetical protein